MKLIFTILVFLISFSVTLGGTRDPSVADKEHIGLAKEADCVVRLTGKDLSGNRLQASAVIVNPKWIITAAHIVSDGTEFGIIIDHKKILVTRTIIHPLFKNENFGYHDIALGVLEKDASLNFYPELYSDMDEEGKQSYICGFGLGGTFATGAKIFDMKRRAGTNMIDRYEKNMLICSIGAYENKPNTKYEFLISSGDSGGGLFIDNKLAGINSCVIASDKTADSDYGDESGHTRISKYIQWIKGHIK